MQWPSQPWLLRGFCEGRPEIDFPELQGKGARNMKSRLAVSVLFTLIAATFAPDAIGAFDKLRSRTVNVLDRYSTEICNRVTSRISAPTSSVTVGDAQRAAIICLDGGRQSLAQNCAIGNQPR